MKKKVLTFVLALGLIFNASIALFSTKSTGNVCLKPPIHVNDPGPDEPW